MTTTDPGSDKAVQAWYALYRRAINEANGLTNYVEDRPELRSAEKRIARIEEEARALTSAPQAQPQSEPQLSRYCLECERLSRELAKARDALQEADTIMGHDDSETEWRERWAGLWTND